MIFSLVKISCFCAKAHGYFIGVYIMVAFKNIINVHIPVCVCRLGSVKCWKWANAVSEP